MTPTCVFFYTEEQNRYAFCGHNIA